MKDNKVKKIVVILFFIVVVLIFAWFLVIHPLIDFNGKEEKLLNGAKEYYEKNSELLPDEGEMSTVSMETLRNKKYVESLMTTYGSKKCNYQNSWVKVKRKNGEYKYYVYLECGNMKSSVDHDGPTIKLNGDEEVTIEKGEKYTDPGIKDIYDDTDGKMSTKDVKTEGKVNTNKIGTYTIKYSATDSFNNKNIVERKINVIQTLDKMVKKGLNKDGLYTGDGYIMVSNIKFLIVGLNEDGTVKLVAAEPIGTVNYDDINEWLNDYFYDHLMDEYKDYMVKQKFCSSKINKNKLDTVTNKCDSTENQYVGILSVSDYNKYKFLNPGILSWTSDYIDDKEAIATRDLLAGTESKYINLNKKYNFVVNPVINLEKDIKIKKGDGTYNNPYQFITMKKGKAGDKINTRYMGEYVQYGNYIYQIIEVDDDETTKVISTVTIGPNILYEDEKTPKVYNPTIKGNIGYTIENTISKYAKTDIFVKKEIEVPIYDKLATYSGKKTVKKYKVKFAAPDMYEMYSGVSQISLEYWLRNSSKQDKTKYVVSNINTIHYIELNDGTYAGMRITGYLNKNATILSGGGTYMDPYVLEK